MSDRDPVIASLARLEVEPIDPHFAARVATRARTELRGRTNSAASTGGFRRVLAAALVPALLVVAAVIETAQAASTVVTIYGAAPE